MKLENNMIRKITFACLVVLISGIWGGAAAYTFPDTTLVQEWNLGVPYGSGLWKDVIGTLNTYDTFGADLSGNTMTFYTNWNPNKSGVDDPAVKTADLFIRTAGASDWNYAIQLDTLTGTGKVYFNPTYQTSDDIFKGAPYANIIYGGKFDQSNPQWIPVQVTSPDTTTTSVVWTIPLDGLNNRVQIDLTPLNLTTTAWSFVWGTATCGNDGISAAVPLPASVLLLGAGLLRLAGFGRRRVSG